MAIVFAVPAPKPDPKPHFIAAAVSTPVVYSSPVTTTYRYYDYAVPTTYSVPYLGYPLYSSYYI